MTGAARGRLLLDASPLRVLGMGTATPGPALSTEALLERLGPRLPPRTAARARALARRMGVRTRHVCRAFAATGEGPRPGEGAAELSAAAMRAALAEAGLQAGAMGTLVGHTATPATPMPPGVAATADLLRYDGPFAELRQACCGFANALTLARGALAAAGGAPAAIVGCETGSVFFDPARAAESPGQLVNLVQMGDGAAAVVLARDDASQGARLSHSFFGQAGLGRAPALTMATGGSDAPAASRPVPEFTHDFAAIREHGLSLIGEGLEAARALGIDPAGVNWIIPHQANGRMAALLEARFGLPRARVFVNADRLGNTGSAAIWLALAELRGRMRPGQTALVLGAEATKFMFGGFLYTHG